MNKRHVFARRTATVTLVTAIASALAGAQTRIVPPDNSYTVAQDVEMGRRAAEEARRTFPLMRDDNVTSFVQDTGRRLASAIPPELRHPEFEYTFEVVNVKEINAFALPGGIVFVNRGTLEAVHDEGELAGVLAHEISHVALRHGTSQMSKAYVAKRGIDIFRTIFGRRDGDADSVAEALGGLGLNTLFLSFSREAETEADLVGARMLAERGYDPIEMSRFFDTLRRVETNRIPEFFSDHPDTGNRAQAVADARATLPVSPTPITVTDGFWSMKKAFRLMPAAHSMRERRVGPDR